MSARATALREALREALRGTAGGAALTCSFRSAVSKPFGREVSTIRMNAAAITYCSEVTPSSSIVNAYASPSMIFSGCHLHRCSMGPSSSATRTSCSRTLLSGALEPCHADRSRTRNSTCPRSAMTRRRIRISCCSGGCSRCPMTASLRWRGAGAAAGPRARLAASCTGTAPGTTCSTTSHWAITGPAAAITAARARDR